MGSLRRAPRTLASNDRCAHSGRAQQHQLPSRAYAQARVAPHEVGAHGGARQIELLRDLLVAEASRHRFGDGSQRRGEILKEIGLEATVGAHEHHGHARPLHTAHVDPWPKVKDAVPSSSSPALGVHVDEPRGALLGYRVQCG